MTEEHAPPSLPYMTSVVQYPTGADVHVTVREWPTMETEQAAVRTLQDFAALSRESVPHVSTEADHSRFILHFHRTSAARHLAYTGVFLDALEAAGIHAAKVQVRYPAPVVQVEPIVEIDPEPIVGPVRRAWERTVLGRFLRGD